MLDSFNNEMRKKNLIPSTKVLSVNVIPSDEKVSNELNILHNSDVIELCRVRFANQEPIVFVTTYIPLEKCSDFSSKNLETESMYEILENKYVYKISDATRTLESILAGEFEAKLLGREKRSAIQYFESLAYLEGGTPIEYSLAKYRGAFSAKFK